MSFRSFLRDMFVFNWLFGNRHKDEATNTQLTNADYRQESDTDHDFDYTDDSSCVQSNHSWQDGYDVGDEYSNELDELDELDEFDDEF